MTIRENLIAAIAAVTNEPDGLFRLTDFERTTSCGTLHCTLGLLATLPAFNAQGLTLEPYGTSSYVAPRLPDDGSMFSTMWHAKLDLLFGCCAYARLFELAGSGDWDTDLMIEEGEYLKDKALALARLNKQLELYP